MEEVSLAEDDGPETSKPTNLFETEEKQVNSTPVRTFRPQRTNSPRRIAIQAVEERGNTFSKHKVYIISCDPPPPGVVSVARRYNDFKWLRNIISQQFPGVFVPPLPPTKTFGRFEEDFIEERKIDLERFLNRVEDVPHFSENLAFQMFLCRPESTFVNGKKEVEERTQEVLLSLQIATNLENIYPDLHEQALPDNCVTEDIPRLKEFLIKMENQLSGFNQSAQKLLSDLNRSVREMKVLTESLENVYQAEIQYPYKGEAKRHDIRTSFGDWIIFQTKQTDTFYTCLLRQMRYEHEDILAFIELFNERSQIETRKNKIVTKCDKWRLKENDGIELTEADQILRDHDFVEEKELNNFLTIVTKIILKSQIASVWKSKTSSFNEQMVQFTRTQSEITKKMMKSWQSSIPS